ncbi:MAG TPA: response regulator transcription factor [Gemmatimonadaceae bacterium]|jgi:two-component system, NarL family, nitrate/nitrite response regulator NarL|nr:response regulator transcription factor [Gemmatimonadaceae bacterium]
MINVVIADDHPIVLAGLGQLIRGEAGMQVVATCVNGVEALHAVHTRRPDILLLDINMPKLDGLGVLRALAAERADVCTVVLTAELDPSAAAALRLAGARAVVLKELSPQHVVDCIRRVHAGAEWIECLGRPPVVTEARKEQPDHPELTPRERELAALVASGLRNREIASRLGISEGTAKLHLYNVYKKLGVANRVELAIRMQGAQSVAS